jgi:cell division protein FtsQ
LVNDLGIDIIDSEGSYFIDQFEIKDLINAESNEYVLGLTIDQLDFKELERRVEANAFVRTAQVYVDVEGNLKVIVNQTKPIARILHRSAPDQYIDEDGKLLPLNAKYTARVPIVMFDQMPTWGKNVNESEFGIQLLEMLRYIERDPIWKPQIAQLMVDQKQEISMLPQVTKQTIFFGEPTDIITKFNKLKLFYKEVLPNKGWNTYSYVNVKFKDQIVCK